MSQTFVNTGFVRFVESIESLCQILQCLSQPGARWQEVERKAAKKPHYMVQIFFLKVSYYAKLTVPMFSTIKCL